jgi:rubrerythrin
MTWTGLCPQCGHDRGEHSPMAGSPRSEPDAEQLLRCRVCSCVMTGTGEPWPPPASP